MKSDQKGFSTIEVVIVVVVLGLIGGVGGYVYRHKNVKPSKPTPVQSAAIDNSYAIETFSQCVAAGHPIIEGNPRHCDLGGRVINEVVTSDASKIYTWTLNAGVFESSAGFKLKLADGWNLTTQDGVGLDTFNNEDIAPKPGTPAVVKQVEGGRDGNSGFFTYFAKTDVFKVDPRGVEQGSLTTSSGLKVKKYYYVETEDTTGPTLPKGGKEYIYLIAKNDMTLRVSYSFVSGAADYHDIVEQALRTVEIK